MSITRKTQRKNKTEEAGKRFQSYESNPEKSSTPREWPGEGTRPYESNPEKSNAKFSIHPT